jgi:hypothetical protein
MKNVTPITEQLQHFVEEIREIFGERFTRRRANGVQISSEITAMGIVGTMNETM